MNKVNVTKDAIEEVKSMEKGGALESGQEAVSASEIKKNMLWNIVGSIGFIAAQWLMTILIVHLADYSEAGILSLGLSLTNIFTNIAYFCIRNYQVSDQDSFTSSAYVTHRLITSIFAMGMYALFTVLNGYSVYTMVFLLLFMAYRLNEAIVDVFHGIDQRCWRLDIAGKSFLLRGILTLLAFLVIEALTKNLIYTTIGMLVAAYLVIALYDVPRAVKNEPFTIRFCRSEFLSLTRECLPLFLNAICLNAVVPIPRYFLEKLEGSEVLGYYASVAIPASFVTMFATYIYTTFTRLFSDNLAAKRLDLFFSLFRKLLFAIIGFVILAVAGSALLGEFVLVMLFTESIREYTYLLVPTVACCGMIAVIWFLGTVLTIIRDKTGILAGAVMGVVVVAVTSYPCIYYLHVDGVNVSLFLSCTFTLLIYMWRICRFALSVRQDEKNKEINE